MHYFLFFLHAFFLPPVALLLCMESLEIPVEEQKQNPSERNVHEQMHTHSCYWELNYERSKSNDGAETIPILVDRGALSL